MRQYVMFQSSLQMETMLANVALEPSDAGVSQFVGLQHRGSLEFRRAKVALEGRIRGVNDHVRS